MVTAQSTQQLDTQEEPLEVEVVAQRYGWTFNYNGTAANTTQEYNATDNRLTNRGTLVIPANRTVRLSVTSTDWLHAVHVPALGLKQDAMPGQHNLIQTRVTETGTYQLYCAEYCGSGHSQMLGQVRVLPQDEYQDWVDEQQSS
jgi:cytochrome c oxidase subunit 2